MEYFLTKIDLLRNLARNNANVHEAKAASNAANRLESKVKAGDFFPKKEIVVVWGDWNKR